MIKPIVLDICKHDDQATQTILLRQGEVASTTLSLSICEDRDAFELKDCEARFMAALPGGEVIIDPCEKTGANTLSYTLPAAICAAAGTITVSYVAIYRGEEWIASTNGITFKILKGVDLSAKQAESALGEFLSLKGKLAAIIADADGQKDAQQSAWEEQMKSQQTAFDAAEAARAEAEAKREQALADALRNVHEQLAITDSEIDAIWANNEKQEG